MHVVVKLSKFCNLRCTYCYEYEELSDRSLMPLPDVARFLDSLGEAWASGERGPIDLVLHGGEPLLLPFEYLRSVVGEARRSIEGRGVRLSISVQSNLTRMDENVLALLEELDIGLGVSFDVLGEERRFLPGKSATDTVLDNLQFLVDRGAIASRRMGGISVLHAGNADRVVDLYRFWSGVGMDFRLLPYFSFVGEDARTAHLPMTHDATVRALLEVYQAWIEDGLPVRVYPVENYFDAAVRHLSGRWAPPLDPEVSEWAVIVNTNGDAYNYGDAYLPDGYWGNVFHSGVAEILAGPERRRTIEIRDARAVTCRQCPYDGACSRVPIVEAVPSERAYDAAGNLVCSIARPVIDAIAASLAAQPSLQNSLARRRAADQEPILR